MPWILQGNPARFDVRMYVAQPNIYWLANRYLDDMQLADHVFIWESGPQGGVVAYGHINEMTVPRKSLTPNTWPMRFGVIRCPSRRYRWLVCVC